MKKYKYKGVQYHAYLGEPTAFNATKHCIKKNNKTYAINTENVVRTNISSNGEYHIVVINKDGSLKDFTNSVGYMHANIGSTYNILPNSWYKSLILIFQKLVLLITSCNILLQYQQKKKQKMK